MILQQYIQDVLFRQQVCIVPGLGTFTLQYSPARYNAVDRSLDPPAQQVTFEENWTDDGSCVEWISLKENLVSSVAQLKLDKYINALKADLQNGQPLDLPGIGTLQLNSQGHIVFREEALPSRPDTLQLRQVNFSDPAPSWTPPASTPPPPVDTYTPPPVTPAYQEPAYQAPAYQEPAYTPPADPTPTPAASSQYAAEQPPTPAPVPPWEQEEQQSRFRWWWVAIPIAAALLATAIWWFVNNQSSLAADNNTEETAPPVIPADTMSMPQEVTPIDTGTAPVTFKPTDTLKYLVVFAEYTNGRANAEKRASQLKRCCNVNVSMDYIGRDSSTVRLSVPFRSLAADTAANIKTVQVNYAQKFKAYLELIK
ncbi:hypothetical protein F0L74_14605 [Chitinophaga agrisoli]|uniref:CCDC81-like prokaryotic HU domain-containing protein n=1 Tax=Chitinophaga agrisoli TaxID=2607653 RepID=A0A5B2VZL2_9BACT|nr:hypothetical protein [Chitinophaga agrisoli]KAA2243706.1 hypothetical protein F0L74_14605 [Chitinophaga agrisoli]